MPRSKLTPTDYERLSAAARTALTGYLPNVTELNELLPSGVTVVSEPLSTGQRAEVSIAVLPLVDIEPLSRKSTDLQVAEALFNAYNDQGPNPWRAFNGGVVPPFADCGDQVRGKWLAVARAAKAALR
jgi:hypothetical protein